MVIHLQVVDKLEDDGLVLIGDAEWRQLNQQRRVRLALLETFTPQIEILDHE